MRYAGAFIVVVVAAGCGGRSNLDDGSSDGGSAVDGSSLDGGGEENEAVAEGGLSNDGGPIGADGGPPGVDSGIGRDSGAPGGDSGTTGEDSGAPAEDSGSPGDDSGAPGGDSGTTGQDSGTPAGDSGATGVDGGTGPVVCGNSTCSPGAECCLQNGGAPTCAAPGECPGLSLPCTSSASCSSGQVCCVDLEIGGGSIQGTSCEPACTGGGGIPGFQLCGSINDCPEGELCLPTPLGLSVCIGLGG